MTESTNITRAKHICNFLLEIAHLDGEWANQYQNKGSKKKPAPRLHA